VRFSIGGPIRDVIVCHCDACVGANGVPWAASATRREHLTVEDPAALVWTKAVVSEHEASRATCHSCGAYVLWDAPERETVSFGAELLHDRSDLVVAQHIWVPEGESVPAARPVHWHD
jgi:hypothetical protein